MTASRLNWLSKISQSVPPSYIGVGHGYRWDSNKHIYDDTYIPKKSVVLWHYQNGQIHEQPRERVNTMHNDEYAEGGPYPAKGRIENDTKIGSILFMTPDTKLKKDILNALVDKYPGIKFSVYARGGPYRLQQYYEMIEQGKDII